MIPVNFIQLISVGRYSVFFFWILFDDDDTRVKWKKSDIKLSIKYYVKWASNFARLELGVSLEFFE